ncbi:MAG: sugar ABC transporter permease [Lachnospiraceae bacterium]|nr:sugar ABC transporter permease [Lachnospiraceae bacterium]
MKNFVGFWKNTWKNRSLMVMALPALILMIMFSYVPMYGVVLAFKKFNYMQGFNSPWCGLDNFKFMFLVGDTFWQMTRNTVGYFLLFTIVGTVGKVMLAIALNEMVFKRAAKFFQSCMVLPHFISYIAISFVVYALLKTNGGLVNQWIMALGGEGINFYAEAERWPLILLIVNTWKNIGYGSVLYLSVLVGIDPGLYEAAELDGANAWQRMIHITIPMLVPMIVITTLLGLGSIMQSDTGLFYQVTKNSGALYSTTQVLDSYVLNAITSGSNFGTTAAVTFYQSIVGTFMIVMTNLFVRKISPDNAIF